MKFQCLCALSASISVRVRATYIVAVAVGTALRLVDQRRLDVRQVALLLRVAELGEDLLLVRVSFVFERDHLISGAELRVPATAARQLRHRCGEGLVGRFAT